MILRRQTELPREEPALVLLCVPFYAFVVHKNTTLLPDVKSKIHYSTTVNALPAP